MTTTDYILDSVLVLLVLRQVRESRMSWHTVLLPISVCAFFGFTYLHSLPTAHNDLRLILGFTVVGALLGLLSACTTRVRRGPDGHALVKAGWIAAAAWVAGMGFRFGFSVWVSHGGDATLARFSMHHGITSGAAWTDALVLMAFGEVFVRTALLVVRSARLPRSATPRTALVAA